MKTSLKLTNSGAAATGGGCGVAQPQRTANPQNIVPPVIPNLAPARLSSGISVACPPHSQGQYTKNHWKRPGVHPACETSQVQAPNISLIKPLADLPTYVSSNQNPSKNARNQGESGRRGVLKMRQISAYKQISGSNPGAGHRPKPCQKCPISHPNAPERSKKISTFCHRMQVIPEIIRQEFTQPETRNTSSSHLTI